jgi:hypothetical protein|eukprot:COSAG02_NODE_2465_length_8785_cov_21.743610_7_plen_38_part_00
MQMPYLNEAYNRSIELHCDPPTHGLGASASVAVGEIS